MAFRFAHRRLSFTFSLSLEGKKSKEKPAVPAPPEGDNEDFDGGNPVRGGGANSNDAEDDNEETLGQ